MYLSEFYNSETDIKAYDLVQPKPGAMIEALRAFGYNLETAIADLIDNSITACSKNVWLNFNWKGKNSTISIKDDGYGMNEEKLVNSMRLGSKNPLEDRDTDDLGRFGFGLKTASFSQCRKLTVGSKDIGSNLSVRCWDLSYVSNSEEWRLLKVDPNSQRNLFSDLESMESGTIVLWENIDNLVKGNSTDDNKSHKLFLERIENVEKHLSMTFHKYLEAKNGLNIWMGNKKIKPWNPFLQYHTATQHLCDENLVLYDGKISVNSFVLPHRSKLDDQTYEVTGGIRGWNDHQGFYVYRNKRLIVPGDWLGLGFPKDDVHKLARIEVNIPNSMDSDWKIDVKKSVARPPSILRDELKKIARITRERAEQVYWYRGKILQRGGSSDFVFVWKTNLLHGNYFCSINRDHPLIREMLDTSGENSYKVNSILRLIEETVPIQFILLKNSENPDKGRKPFEELDSKKINEVIKYFMETLLKSGMSVLEARNKLKSMEPFNEYPDIIENLQLNAGVSDE
ncbi:ATP-binding protein [Methanosarcina sp. Ant1]|nr:ATP-binding protein [Methanosarcina sp. Ant1]